MLVDYHVHPNYSIDSRGGSISEFCQKALEVGLSEVCFTTHYDVDPQRLEVDGFVLIEGEKVSVNSPWVDRYLTEINEAREAYQLRGLRVLSGLEVDYGSDFEGLIRESLTGYEFDYLLGAIHCLDHCALSVEPEAQQFFESRDAKIVCKEYYQEVERAIASDLFDAIAHLDFYKRKGVKYYGKAVLDSHNGLVEPVLRLLAEKNVALEINALGYKDNFGEPYPGENILRMAKKQGIRLVTVGSDCHSLDLLGSHLEEIMKLVEEYDFKLWRAQKS